MNASVTEDSVGHLIFGYTIRSGISMKVAKWGNSLAVRLPAAVVELLGLKAGDQIEIRVAGTREFEIGRDRTREEVMEQIRRSRVPLPPGFRFDRDEANAR